MMFNCRFNILFLFLLILSPFSIAEDKSSIENGVRISSDDGLHKFHLGGYVLFDVIPVDDRENAIERFDLFNAWLHIVGTSYNAFDYKIQFSLEDSNTTKLRDGYIRLYLSQNIKIRLGQYDMPTIAEHLSALTYTSLAGRSIVDSLTPGRDVGMMMEGSLLNKNWHFSLGLFNGNGIDANKEENKSKDISGRLSGLVFHSQKSTNIDIYTDFSFTYGKQVTDNILFRSESGETMLSVSDLNVGKRLRLAAGIYTYYDSSSLKFTYLKNDYELTNENATGTSSAWSVLFSYLLTGEKEKYESAYFQKIKPHQNFSQGKGGAWQLVMRYSQWQASTILVQAARQSPGSIVAADKANAFSIGINWILTPNARINTSWIRTKFDIQKSPVILTSDTQDALLARFTLQFF